MSITNNKNPPLQEEEDDDEDFIIDMESSSKTPTSSPQTKEFEFQNMSLAAPSDKATCINTADDLFYKGKLLPLLLLPSRRHVLMNLTEAGTFDFTKMPLFEQDRNTYHSTPPTKTLNTPLDSRNISPSESCRASCELNPDDDYFFEWSTELSGFVTKIDNANSNTNRSCRKKLIWYSKKLKATRVYLKSLFTKDAISCSSRRKSEEIADKYVKVAKTSTTTIAAIMKSNFDDGGRGINGSSNVIHNRRSFSSAIKRHSPTMNNKCLTSSDSSSSGASSSYSRTSSATEIEGSIEAAIDHCKKSSRVL